MRLEPWLVSFLFDTQTTYQYVQLQQAVAETEQTQMPNEDRDVKNRKTKGASVDLNVIHSQSLCRNQNKKL